MESLIVLIALENRWPLEEMCYFNSHVNKGRPREPAFPPAVLEHLRRILAPDEEIVRCAGAAHQHQAARHGNFSKALRLFQSSEFRQKCEDIKRERDYFSKAESHETRERACWLELPPVPLSVPPRHDEPKDDGRQ